MRVAFKYCGSCNPRIDLSRIGRELRAKADSKGIALVPFTEEDLDVVVILNGCLIACADRDEVRDRASHSVVVAGETVDMVATAEREIPGVVQARLEAWLVD